MKASDVKKKLEKLSDRKRALVSQGYFKTYEGGYGEGDKFLGLTVPIQRKVAKEHIDLLLAEVRELLESKIHEHRFVALEILAFKYKRGNDAEKKKIVNFYLKNRKYVDNWDLVDTSAPYILGDWLIHRDKSVLYKLARSKRIWDRRIAIVSTQAFIKVREFKDTLKIAEMLLGDTHDLIHKASGWMLREVGKKSRPTLETFLRAHHKKMPRTMLRYAIEHFPESKRQRYMKK